MTGSPEDRAVPADSDERRPWVRYARPWVWFVVLFAIGWFALNFHGLAFHLTPWSQKIVNGIVKYTYDLHSPDLHSPEKGQPRKGEPRKGQEQTTVLLFREEDLEALNGRYPVSYEQHAKVLEWLSRYRPHAVFVDFVFIDKRPRKDVEHLSQAISRLTRAGTPVYLAVAKAGPSTSHATCGAARTARHPKHASDLIEPGPELLRCAIPVSVKMDTEFGVSGVLTYGNGSVDGDTFLPAPAFAMASDELGCCTEPHEPVLPPGVDRLRQCVKQQAPMEIVWANGVAPLNKKWMQKWMHCEAESWSTELFESLREDPLAVKLPCPYTRTISVTHLKNSLPPPGKLPEFLDLDVFEALHGKTVFYGAGFQLAGDILVSPVYRALPAVYLHAMAYDNLLTYGVDYKRADRGARLAPWVNGAILLLIVVILLSIHRLI